MNACQYVTLQDKVVNAEEMKHLFVDPYPGRSAGTGEKVNPFVKAGNSLWGIGKDVWHGFEVRGDKAFDSWYDFGNYITSGILDGTKQGLETRAAEMKESPSVYSVTNWLSMGSLDLVNGAVNPDEALSKEHLTSNLALIGLLGITKVPVKSGGSNTVKSAGKAAKTENKVGSAKHGEKSSTKSVSRASTPIVRGNLVEPFQIPTVNNLINSLKKSVQEVGVVQDSAGGKYWFVRKCCKRQIDRVDTFKSNSLTKNNVEDLIMTETAKNHAKDIIGKGVNKKSHKLQCSLLGLWGILIFKLILIFQS